MAIIRKDQAFPERPVIIVLYGTPGCGKTSVSCTANNPILIDADKGADRACNRVDTIVAAKWDEVVAEEQEFKNYDTCILDTAKAILDDYLMVYVIDKDYKLKTNKLKAYGAIGEEFKAFTNVRRSESSDIIIVAHAKEEKDGDLLRLSPDVTGQSKDLILRIADQVGFVTMVNNKRTITFEPTDKTIGKNVARIPTMEIPDENDPKFKTFMADIIALVKSSIRAQSEEQVKSQQLIAEFEEEINKCAISDDLIVISEKCALLPKHLQAGMRKLLTVKITELGLAWDKESKTFIPKA